MELQIGSVILFFLLDLVTKLTLRDLSEACWNGYQGKPGAFATFVKQLQIYFQSSKAVSLISGETKSSDCKSSELPREISDKDNAGLAFKKGSPLTPEIASTETQLAAKH